MVGQVIKLKTCRVTSGSWYSPDCSEGPASLVQVPDFTTDRRWYFFPSPGVPGSHSSLSWQRKMEEGNSWSQDCVYLLKSKSVNRGEKVHFCLRPWRLGNSNVQGQRWQSGKYVWTCLPWDTPVNSCTDLQKYVQLIWICRGMILYEYRNTQTHSLYFTTVYMQVWVYMHKWNILMGLKKTNVFVNGFPEY